MERNNYDPKVVGANFKKVRIAAGWGQEKLAFELGYSNNSQLSEFENGKGSLPMDKLQQAVNLLGVPLDMIRSDTEFTDRQAKLIVAFTRKMLDQGPGKYRHFEAIETLLDQ
jgi:transcriptional regulator with XRE-family HTH domain